MSFDDLGLSAELLRAVSEQGYTEPTPVQKQAIPVVLQGKDLLAGAQTGTGKTAGFTLPLLQRLSQQKFETAKRPIRALVLTPTRELAAQVEESIKTYGKYVSLRSNVIFGGVKIGPQIAKLRRNPDIIVATPGRLLDHLQQKNIDLSKIEILVLDEADRMLDMGFIRDIQKIMAMLPKQRQTLLFSATFSKEIKKLSETLLKSPALIEVARQNTTSEIIEQIVYPVDKSRKRELLSTLIKKEKWYQVLVFTRTKHGADRLSQQLNRERIPSVAIHGNKSQNQRTNALASFKDNKVQVLVATDVAARGLDIDQLPHVVNYELPNVPEDYVHRIGRTGRAGNEGIAVSLVCIDEKKSLIDIEKLINRQITKVIIDGFEPDPTIKAEPVKKKSSQGRGRSQKPRSSAAKTSDRNSKPGKPRRRRNKRSTGSEGDGSSAPRKNPWRKSKS
ncbi:MAG: DEAD/DEAH box helicase [Gammaproteobacteria bacterium]